MTLHCLGYRRDTAGQERFRTITTAYYRGAMGIMLVYDITNEKSFDNIKNWIRNIEEHASADVEKMILGNKCDMNDKRQVNAIHFTVTRVYYLTIVFLARFQKTAESNLLSNTESNSWKLVRKHQSM